MANRKDARGYVLRDGESYRQDRRYSYTYCDMFGKRHYIYTKDLPTLRKKEQQIRRDIEDGLDPNAAERITVNQLFDSYISQKYDLKETTKANYIYTYDTFVRDTFGKLRLAVIKYTLVKKFYYSLLLDRELKPASVDNVHTLLHPAFQMAVRDGILRQNPTDGVMTEIKKSHLWEKGKRPALTIPQQKALMNYLNTSGKYAGWRPIITILLGTGMRIGECLGLRWEDLDFDKRIISINHGLVYRRIGDEDRPIHINIPKTRAGCRNIPMLKEVYDAFLEEYQFQKITGFCKEEIDGYSGFVFTTQGGNVTNPEDVNRAIKRIIAAYNSEETEKAKTEKREPLLLPQFSAHSLRHTFCTRFCENETNLKVIQTIMGHSDIQTTMDIYADCTEEKKQEVITNMENKILIS